MDLNNEPINYTSCLCDVGQVIKLSGLHNEDDKCTASWHINNYLSEMPRLVSSVGYSIILIHQLTKGCRFNPWSKHIAEATNECINKWNNKSLSLKLINKKILIVT